MKKLHIDNVTVLRELVSEGKENNELLGFDEYPDNITVHFKDSESRKSFRNKCQEVYPV